jgi:hypothetical protein
MGHGLLLIEVSEAGDISEVKELVKLMKKNSNII